jgi:hypothetical protein
VTRHLPRLLSLLCVAAVAAVVAVPASAATTHRDRVTATVHRQSQKGSTIIYTGSVSSSLFGRGTVRQTVHLTGLNVTGSFVITYKGGTIRGSTKAKAKLHLDGTSSFTGTERITGGTGRYGGAHGSGSYTGSGSLTKATFKQTGTVTY